MGDDRYLALKALFEEQFAKLKEENPTYGKEGAGITLMLGTHYAHPEPPRILMLGVNPGWGGSSHTEFAPENYLLGDPANTEFAYWRNARRCFGASPDLEEAFETATFGFGVPFRTRTWSGLPKKERERLKRLSKPVLQRIVADCDPEYVICAGKTSRWLFEDLTETPLAYVEGSERGDPSHKTARWAELMPKNDTSSGPTILEVPHFSRFNAHAALHACGLWLAERMKITG